MAERIDFDKGEEKLWGDAQAKVSKLLKAFLASGKSFYIEFGFTRRSKTHKQLRGIYRIIKLYAARLSEAQGEEISDKTAKDGLKYEFNITRLANYEEAFAEALRIKREKKLAGEKMSYKDFNFLVNALQKTLEVPKSFADMSIEEATKLIKDIEQKWFVGFGWSEMQLLPEELRTLTEYFNENK